MSNTIIQSAAHSYIEVGFTWTPTADFSYTTPGGVLLEAPGSFYNTTITFAGNTTIHDITDNVRVVEYFWDFGDGVTRYGKNPKHAYAVPYPFVQTVLRVTDNLGRNWYSRASMYLR